MLDQKKRHSVVLISLLYMLFVLILAQLVFLRGIHNLKDIYLINIGIDFVGMLTGFTLYVCCYIDLQKTGNNVRYLMALINTTFLSLFTDGVAWLVDELPQFRYVNIMDNTLYYLCTPLSAYFFWMYTMSYLNIKKNLLKKLSRAVRVGLYISISIRFINIFNGIYFTVNELGVYSRTQYNWFSLVYSIVTVLSALVMVIIERNQLEIYQVITFFMYTFAPVAVGILTMFVYGLSIGPAVIMLDILLMYCVLNVSEGQEKAAAARDMSLAGKIQQAVLPSEFPYLPERKEFDLYATMTPAKEVGGDFYDFFMVDEDELALVMADVSGKGIVAALFMMVSKALIKNGIRRGQSPANVLKDVNNQLCEGNKANMFVTVWLATINVKTGAGISANAGHEHPVIKHADGQYELLKYKHSPAVATMEDIPFKEHEFLMEPGDSIFVYTDGVPEASNSENELFGTDRMLNALNKEPDAKPEKVLENVMKGINSFVAGTKQFDDITMLCMTYHGA
ncbi:Stage II sporulation protein E (SpoIIE) [Pseudobutyrivibrio sp. YE44]|uniref:PP2C family protein-serine/threonine phosphatase n=1 Tax=Pseudobutyrivibrio sp. YE44 TaxID=1520802 RepID=UPI00087EDECE|nr:PP2C family protein-serine/threonine phosphatase [Pseudobutyrivibrio sp. YE44]SDB05603.1 Stage II sporulation protein E (SpoIIE) [Pseudobutyrivibrio sp. YE44]